MTGARATPALRTSGFFVLRAPLLPFDEFERLFGASGEAGVAAGEPRSAEALEVCRTRSRERLLSLVRRPEVREALFLASPDLFDAVDAWVRDPHGERGQRVERSLARYVARMAGRPTPFGLFGASSVASLGERTALLLEGPESLRRRSRLDSDYLFRLERAFAEEPSRLGGLLLRPNSSLYRSHGRLRLVEISTRGTERSYRLVGFEETDAIRETVLRAAEGRTRAELAEALVDDDIDLDEAAGFVDELVTEQLLVPDSGLTITGLEPEAAFSARLARAAATAPVARRLEAALAELGSMDASGPGVDPDRYRRLAARLSDLPAAPELSRLVQVDLVRAAPGAVLGGEVLAEIEHALRVVHRLLPRADAALSAFREAFAERYGRRRVPLVEALDEESGIGFPAYAEEGSAGEALLEGLPFPGTDTGSVPWGCREQHLLRRLSDALRGGTTEMVFTPEEIAGMVPEPPAPLPGAFAVVARIAAPSAEAVAHGDFRVILTGIDGPPGACVLARFCEADPDLYRGVAAHLRQEEALEPEAVFAEVVHLPEERLGNVLRRPLLRDFEIPYLGASGAPPDRRIPVSDLLVSVERDEVRLHSRRLARRVIPRLTTAHNYTIGSLGLYRFLCELQTQNVAVGRVWSWGPLADAPFLPRVRVGRTVLSASRWNLGKEDLARLSSATADGRFHATQALRRDRGLPRVCLLADGDNELPLDLDSPLSVEVFVHLVKGRDQATVVEMLPAPDELLATGPEGRFVHEIVLPFVVESGEACRAVGAVPTTSATPEGGPPVRRAFLPGSEWLTAKLYAGAATLDRVLIETAGPLAREAVASGTADRWFFLRYADPRPHLRLRLHGRPDRLRRSVLRALGEACERLRSEGSLHGLQVDTWEREVERYGGSEAIGPAEEVFFADSEAALEILEALEGGGDSATVRWRLALAGTDAIFDDLGVDAAARRAEVARAREDLAEELRVDAALSRALGERWRAVGREIDSLLASPRPSEGPLAAGLATLARRSARIASPCSTLRELDRAGRLGRPLPVIAGTFVHMFLNRLLRAAQRRQELVIFDMLSRLYASRAARGRA